MRLRIKMMIAGLACAGLAVVVWWCKQQYVSKHALFAVEQYLKAELDLGGKMAGSSSSNLSGVAYERLARCQHPSSFIPLQTNGNRIRRLIQGREPEEPLSSVDYSDCLIRFYVRRQVDGSWLVYRVHTHAG